MIEVKTSGTFPRLTQRMRGWRNSVRGGLLDQLAKDVVVQTTDRITKSKSSADNVAWPARKSGGSHPLLEKTGALVKSIREARQSKDFVAVGSSIGYDKFHQQGTSRMDARPFYGLSSSNLDDVEKRIERWVSRWR